MRLAILSMLTFFLLSFQTSTDVITFGRIIFETAQNYSVQQTLDGGYITSGIFYADEGYETRIIKTNPYGEISWIKSFPGRDQSIVRQCLDNGYILLTEDQIDYDVTKIFLIRTDEFGDTLWTKEYGNQANNLLRQIIQTKDGGFLFAFEEPTVSMYLVKTDSFGNMVWQNEQSPRSSFRPFKVYLEEDKNNNFYYCHRFEVSHFDKDGQTIWRKILNDFRYTVRLSNGNFFLCNNSVYETATDESKIEYLITDSLANILVTDRFFVKGRFEQRTLSSNNENKVIMAGNGIVQFDINTGNYSFKETRYTINDFDRCSDGGYILTGWDFWGYDPGILIKTDSMFVSSFILLNNPVAGEMIPRDYNYYIRWIADDITNVNIAFSINDDGWQEIVYKFPADSGIYRWHTPGVSSSNVKIRISDSDNPQISTQNHTPFAIGAKDYDCIATNQVLMWFGNNGDGSHDPMTDGNGFYWPGALNATQSAIFEDGLLWGGYVGDSIRVNGNTHRQGLQPGNILQDGTAGDPADPQYGIWRAKADWQSLPDGGEKDRLEYDWNNWPVDLGAPWIDNNFDAIYDPQIDQPKISGDEIFWMVMNDMDTVTTRFTYGSDPIGLEIKLHVYAYDQDNDLADVVFKKYQVFNKGQNSVDSMFFAYWSDPDLGGAGDDYVGCDTLLNLAYCYNDDDNDAIYEAPVPAVGYLLLQGPKVKATDNDQALFFDKWVNGYTNANMYAFTLFIGGSSFFSDPSQGAIEGSYQFYNIFNGFRWNGQSILDPNTNKITKYALPGDPENGVGWYEGNGWPGGASSGDRRVVMSSGPFDFAAGDSQEVVYAIIIARGENYLNSVTELKRKAAAVKKFYYTGVLPTAIEEKIARTPERFQLHQNYPNPFNPNTIINYELRIKNYVKLLVYDVLGREVKTLVNKEQLAGKYQVTFDASGLSSGIYYYKLQTKDFQQTRKMLLLK